MVGVFRYCLLEKGLQVQGRTGLKTFWIYTLGLVLNTLLVKFVCSGIADLIELIGANSKLVKGITYLGDILFGLWLPIFFILLTIAAIRRLHDSNHSSRNMLWNFVPFGCFYVLYLLCLKGDIEENNYGQLPESQEQTGSDLSLIQQGNQFRHTLYYFFNIFTQNIKSNRFSVKGRASRLEYWSFCGFTSVIVASLLCCYGAIVLIGFLINGALLVYLFTPIVIIVQLVLFLLYLTNSIRRLQDVERPWYFVVCLFIPFVNLYITSELMSLGTEGANEYGDNPIEYEDYYDI